MQSDFEFASKDDGKTWTRRCFGIEQFVGVMASKTPGFGALTGGYLVVFPRPVSAATLRPLLDAAWVRVRATAPLVAYKTKDASKSDNSKPQDSLYFEYAVPIDAQDVAAWARETIKWHEDKMTLRERDIAMKDIWWRADDGRYNYELHVAPDVEENKWQIMMHSAHWSADVRGVLQLSELLFKYLNEYLVLRPEQEELNIGIKWGEETKKLTPPGAIVAAMTAGMPVSMLFPKPSSCAPAPTHTETGAPPWVNGEADEKYEERTPPPAGPVFFLKPTPLLDESPVHDAVASDVWLTQEETALFRAACRRHGFSVTQILTALMAVAEVEWALTHHEGRSADEKKQLIDMYENATHLPSLWNVVDQRYKYKEYARHDSPKGSVPFGAEGFPLVVDMTAVRQAVKYNMETGNVERDTSDAVFWGVVAKHCQDLWIGSDMDIPAFLEREMMCDVYSTMYDPNAYMIPALMSSSVGDIEQLGLLTDFSPSIPVGSGSKSTHGRLLVEQVSISVRCPTPVKMVLAWQWNGRLLIRPQTASRWTSQKGLDKMGEMMHAWIESACLSPQSESACHQSDSRKFEV